MPDLLEQLKKEYEGMIQESNVMKSQRDDLQGKLENQVSEMQLLQENLRGLEQRHLTLKKTYEEEIVRLRRQVEAAGGSIPPSLNASMPQLGAGVPASLPVGGLPAFANLGVNRGNGHGTALAEPAGLVPGGGAAAAARVGGDPSKAVDSKGRPLDDWNVVHNPNATTKMHLELAHSLEHDSVVCCVRFSSDGRFIATGCNKTAVLYDAETGARLCMLSNEGVLETQVALDNLTCGDSYVRSVCFSPDSKLLVAGAEDKTIKVWDIHGRRLRHTLHGHTKDIYSVDFSADGRYVVSGSGDKRAKLWDVTTGECVRTFGDEEGPKDGVTSVAVSPDGRWIAAGSLDRMVRLWDAASGALVDKYDGHNDSVYSVSFSPDAKLLASGSLDKTIKLWDLSTVGNRTATKCRHTFQGHKDFVLSVVFAPQGPWLISGSKDRSVQFWDPRHLALPTGGAGEEGPQLILQGHQNSVISVAHSPAGRLFATGSGDKRARIWRY